MTDPETGGYNPRDVFDSCGGCRWFTRGVMVGKLSTDLDLAHCWHPNGTQNMIDASLAVPDGAGCEKREEPDDAN